MCELNCNNEHQIICFTLVFGDRFILHTEEFLTASWKMRYLIGIPCEFFLNSSATCFSDKIWAGKVEKWSGRVTHKVKKVQSASHFTFSFGNFPTSPVGIFLVNSTPICTNQPASPNLLIHCLDLDLNDYFWRWFHI